MIAWNVILPMTQSSLKCQQTPRIVSVQHATTTLIPPYMKVKQYIKNWDVFIAILTIDICQLVNHVTDYRI